jgi:outer membrane lipoprotein-sorting protein
MKKLLSIIAFIAFAGVAIAQTPEEIISRMEAEMAKHDEKEGLAMTMDMKIPILGTFSSRTYTLGDKYRIEVSEDGKQTISWSDGKTDWTYSSEKNEIEIKKHEVKEKTETEGDAKMFSGITDGYDVKLDKETSDSWQFLCKRSKSNPDKDAPKKMTLIVAKGTYMPISLSAKVSAITITMRDLSYGVTEEQVTFNPKNYPNATIVDKR